MFSDRLLHQLGLSTTPGRDQDAPLRVEFGDGHTLEWHETQFESRGSNRFSMRFTGELGLVAELEVLQIPDTNALEVRGSITNSGSSVVSDITGVSTLSLWLDLHAAAPGTLVRTWEGVRFLPNYFPPSDFTATDRYLVDTPQLYTPLAVHGGADGRSSSHDLSFMQLLGTDGGLSVGIEWSGTWFISAKQDASTDPERRPGARLEAGIWGLELELGPGDTITLPSVTLVAFRGDQVDGQNALRRHIRRHVTPTLGGEPVLPPTSFNSWFAFGNSFTDGLLRPAVDAAASVGLEYFVVDGGWYAGGFRTGIGNWSQGDPAKFSDGVAPFSRYVQEAGLKYGTWFEPEFAHLDSEIYAAHPEWFILAPQGSPYATPTNHQFDRAMSQYALMDFGLPAVREYWVDRITEAYDSWNVRWIRWDFNQQPRPHWDQTSDPSWRQIRHVEGLYEVLDHVIGAMPDLFIEQCASGGNRIDLGTVRRGHSFWMNDHTTQSDIVRRLQTRLNQVLPANYANTNLCQPGHDFSDYDFLSHSSGGFGYSGRLWEASPAQLERYSDAWKRYKSFREILLGDYSYELDAPTEPSGREVHVWNDSGRSVTIEFNGSGGPRSAEASINV